MTRHGGKILIESLMSLGARTCFGVPGESFLAALDAMHDTKGEFDFVLCRNEGGAAFMAAAWGKLTGQPGIAFVTRGPGVTNASIGIHTAMQDSAPMLVFVGQVGADMKGREAFQEIDYRAVFGSMAKWAVEIDAVERLPEIVSRAWSLARSGRPGPVVVALPEDMLSAQAAVAPLSRPVVIHEPVPDTEAVEEARALLARARRPVLLYGGCNWSDAGRAALLNFSERSNIPVISAFRYQDQFDNHSQVFIGEAGVGMPPHVRQKLVEADVVLAINTRFGEITTDGYSIWDLPVPQQKLIHVHGSDSELGKVYQPDLAIQAGPNAFVRAIGPVQGDWGDWCAEGRAAYEAFQVAPKQESPVDMARVMRFLQGRLPDDAILTNGAGNFSIWNNKHFRYGPGQRLLAPQSGAMGYGLPAAIAARIAHPDRMVVCFAGDGDFQMNLQELACARQAGAVPVILVLNNGSYGTIRAHQERQYPGRVSGTDMLSPDFAALAQSYGLHGERVTCTQDFEAAFERAVVSETGGLLDLAIATEAITPRMTLSQMRESARNRR